MSTIVNHPCTRCKNSMQRDMSKPYGMPRCKAFPNGIPYEYSWVKDVTKLDECNNGYKFEEEPNGK